MDQFLATLKAMVQAKKWQWNLVLCGGRHDAYKAFLNAQTHQRKGEIVVLLVDSETSVTAASRAAHLRERPGDKWTLTDAQEDRIHLMVQTMETWIVADPEALATYYGQHFKMASLPARLNLEEEPKVDCETKLRTATRHTQKREYHKIKHAGALLALISADKVRKRCPHAEIMFSTPSDLLA